MSFGGVDPSRAVADFDSASAFLRATAAALRGDRFRWLGQSRRQGLAVHASSGLPRRVRTAAYRYAGAREALAPEVLGDVDADAVAGWLAGHYPSRRYPGVAIGSSNGAAVHLWAALGIPWLPQTTLLPVRRNGDPEDPRRAMDAGARAAAPLLSANPDIALHQMHDANQDRLMVAKMSYFRLKRLRLGPSYESFLSSSLRPGAPIFLVRDRSRWPVTRVADRHVFQVGAQGGVSPQEYLDVGGSARSRNPPPAPDADAVEAEWGFAEPLRSDVHRWAAEHGHPVLELEFDHPQDLSGPVADLYRWDLARRDLSLRRLVVESFILVDPTGVRRSGSVPYWTFFPVEPALRRLAGYLDDRPPFPAVWATMFPHGTRSIGWAPPGRWREQCGRGSGPGGFLGVRPGQQPADFAALARFEPGLHRCADRNDPPPLTVADLVAWDRSARGPIITTVDAGPDQAASSSDR
jgi:hypothetical protein